MDARELFKMLQVLLILLAQLTNLSSNSFYHGCSTFLWVSNTMNWGIFNKFRKTRLRFERRYIWSIARTFPVCRWLYLHGSCTSAWWRRYVTILVKLSLPSITISGKSSELYLKCLEEVQAISSATLFAPVVRSEAVQSMSLSPLQCIQSIFDNQYFASLSSCVWLVWQWMAKWRPCSTDGDGIMSVLLLHRFIFQI